MCVGTWIFKIYSRGFDPWNSLRFYFFIDSVCLHLYHIYSHSYYSYTFGRSSFWCRCRDYFKFIFLEIAIRLQPHFLFLIDLNFFYLFFFCRLSLVKKQKSLFFFLFQNDSQNTPTYPCNIDYTLCRIDQHGGRIKREKKIPPYSWMQTFWYLLF